MLAQMAEQTLQTGQLLATEGHYAASLALLALLDQNDAGVRGVQAQILAQRGDYRGAIAAWRQVLRTQPDDRGAQAGIQRAESAIRSRWHGYSISFKAACAAMLSASLAVAVIGVVSFWPGTSSVGAGPSAVDQADRTGNDDNRPASPQVLTTASELQELRRELDTLRNAFEPVRKKTMRLENQLDSCSQELEWLRAETTAKLPSVEQYDHRLTKAFEQSEAAKLESATFAEQIASVSAQVRKVRCEMLRHRADELALRSPQTTDTVRELRAIAQRLLALPCGTSTERYAQRLLDWCDRVLNKDAHSSREPPPSGRNRGNLGLSSRAFR